MEDNNIVELVGTVCEAPKFSHESYNEKFYTFKIGVKRTSGVKDIVPILISENLFHFEDLQVGKRVDLIGQFRSYNLHEETRVRLVLNVFATDLISTTKDEDVNSVILNGYLCKKPAYRQTPLGREIADLLIAVNRVNGNSDYIPIVVWGRNAKIASNYSVGELINIDGRIQSRKYIKAGAETRIAYEVSAKKICKIAEIAV